MSEYIKKSDVRHLLLHNDRDTALAKLDELEAVDAVSMVHTAFGYSVRDLVLFAELCKRNDVQEADLKKAAWNLEHAVRAVENERQEMFEDEMKKITMRLTPDFEKAFEEMMREEQTDADS